MNTENRYQETDLGNISPNPRGEYTPGTEYEYLDLVTFDGGSYICTVELGATTSISPESGKTTDFWQCMTIPGDMTPEYVAMHDRVVNLSEQVEADAEEARTAEQNVSGMKENVTQMQEQTRQSAESAERSKDSAAGYADSADASRQAAETSEQNINAQVAGFDAHVDEKTSESNQIIEAARIAANKAILAQQEQSVNEVARVGGTAVSEAQAAAQTATEKAQAAAASEKNAAASETAAKLSEENATKMAEQVATDKEQVAYDRTAVENAKQEMTGSVAQIEQNTQGITELKGDLAEHEDMICMVEYNNIVDLSYTNIYGCVFSSPTYVNKFKCIFTDDSYGSVTYVLAKTNDNEKIKEGSALLGIEGKRFTVDINEFINIDILLDESYAILVATNENAHIKIVNSTKSTYGAYLCQMNESNNTIENYDIHKNNYRFAMSFSGKIIGNKVNVRQDGTGDFESITEALSHFFYGDDVTIMLGKGKYNESINVGNKYNLSIIGEDKERCIVYNTTGKYRNCPFTIQGNVYMENIQLAMYADDNFIPDISSQDTFAGYALHIDGVSRDSSAFNYATFVNCKFYSTAFPAVGLGTQQRQSIKFYNCEFIRNCTNENYKFDNWKGAFIGHPDNGSEQNLTFMNCYFESNYGKSGNLRTDVGEPYNLTLMAINNTFYSKEKGLNSFEYIQGQTHLHGSSHGNTSTNLNVG